MALLESNGVVLVFERDKNRNIVAAQYSSGRMYPNEKASHLVSDDTSKFVPHESQSFHVRVRHSEIDHSTVRIHKQRQGFS